MIVVNIVKVIEQTRIRLQTDKQMDGRTDGRADGRTRWNQYTPTPTNNYVVGGGTFFNFFLS